jgi:hypothetical protein
VNMPGSSRTARASTRSPGPSNVSTSPVFQPLQSYGMHWWGRKRDRPAAMPGGAR